MARPERIFVTSLYGAKSGEGRVQIALGSETAQLGITEAIHHARVVLEAANAAATDATLAWFLTDKLGVDRMTLAAVLLDFRRCREAQEPR